MARTTRKLEHATAHEVALTGRRTPKSAPNSLQFFAHVEGVTEYDGRVRSANGMRWKVA